MTKNNKPEGSRDPKSLTKIDKDDAKTSHEELTDEELDGVKGAIGQIGTSTYTDTSDTGNDTGDAYVTIVSNYIDAGSGKKKKKK